MKESARNSIVSWIAIGISIISLLFGVVVPFVRGLWSPGVSAYQSGEFKVYHNVRYGFEISYPKTWIVSLMPTNGDGASIIDPVDPGVQIRVYDAHATGDAAGGKASSQADIPWHEYVGRVKSRIGGSEAVYERAQEVSVAFGLGNGKPQEYAWNVPGILVINYITPLHWCPYQYEIISQIKGVRYYCIIKVPWYRSPYYKSLITYMMSTFKVTPYNGESGTNMPGSYGKANISSPENWSHTHKPFTIVSGKVESPELFPELYINGNLTRYGSDGYFSCKVNLIPGRNVIKVVEWYKAFGLDLRTAELSIYYDKR